VDGALSPVVSRASRLQVAPRVSDCLHSAWAGQLGATRFDLAPAPPVETGAGCSLALKAQNKIARGKAKLNSEAAPRVGGLLGA
jgi:hypothetical protein